MRAWISSRDTPSKEPVTQNDFPLRIHDRFHIFSLDEISRKSSEMRLLSISEFSEIYTTNALAVSGQISLTSVSSSSVREVIVSKRKVPSWCFLYITFAMSFAVFLPTFGIPMAVNTLSRVVFLAFSIDSRRLFTDFSLYHSREKNSSRCS